MRSTQLLAIARRYTLSWNSGYLSSVLSLLSVLGLVMAIALLVLVLSVMNGFDREMRENILALVPQLSVRGWAPVEDWEQAREQLRRHPEVVAVSPYVELQGLLVNKNHVDTVQVFGVQAEAEAVSGQLTRVLAAQQWQAFASNEAGVLLGSELAARLQLAIGERVTLIVPGPRADARAAAYQHLVLEGLIDTGTELDESAVFMSLPLAAELLGRPGSIDGFRLQLRDLFSAPRVGWEIIGDLAPTWYARDWTMTHGNLYAAIQMSRDMIGLLLLSIIAIAAFNVVSSLVLVVIDKRGDIAVLRALGASPRDIGRIFRRQGLLIAVLGCTVGSLLGSGASLWVTEAVAGLEALLGIRFLNTDVYPIGYMPSDLRLSDVLLINGVALSLCYLAAVYPARRAARLPPAEALRHE